ncbi:MAG TPA: catalase family protein [Candidatus Limnocylindria bacterium]|nr:catalase family protein [Candidatus Limnocylindria bacterium]
MNIDVNQLQPRRTASPALKLLHETLFALLKIERRFDPFFRPALDAIFQEPLARGLQFLTNLWRDREILRLAEERKLPDEEAYLDSIISEMAAHMRQLYQPGSYERGGNTKTHGVVRGEFTVRGDLAAPYRHGVFAEPRTFPAWVRFAGPGPAPPADIDDVGVLSIGIKLMGVPGQKLLDDEKFTQDFTGITTPIFTTPDVKENAKLQARSRAGVPLFYFISPGDSHLLDALMQGLWARTHTSPLEARYWSCVPYLLGAGAAMQYSIVPKAPRRSRVPRLPSRPPDNYLRENMAATLSREDAEFDFTIQLQTDAHLMPIENASVRWPENLSPPKTVATLRIAKQKFDSPAQLAFAHHLSYNPWHSVAEHRPLGNQNRGRKRIYQELSRLRQEMNQTPHREPTGDEAF